MASEATRNGIVRKDNAPGRGPGRDRPPHGQRVRRPGEIDAFEWYCEKCHALLHRREVQLGSIVDDLPPIFAEYYAAPGLRVCKSCGHANPGKPA